MGVAPLQKESRHPHHGMTEISGEGGRIALGEYCNADALEHIAGGGGGGDGDIVVLPSSLEVSQL